VAVHLHNRANLQNARFSLTVKSNVKSPKCPVPIKVVLIFLLIFSGSNQTPWYFVRNCFFGGKGNRTKTSSGPGQVLGSWAANRVFAIHLVQWLGWVFETQERKKERKTFSDAGSSINFRTTFPDSHFSTSFFERDFKFCFTWYPTDIILCLWSGFISPPIRTFVEKCFHGLFSKKKDSKSGGVPSFLIWSWGQLFPLRKTFPTRLLGLLEKQSKIWRHGHSWTHV